MSQHLPCRPGLAVAAAAALVCAAASPAIAAPAPRADLTTTRTAAPVTRAVTPFARAVAPVTRAAATAARVAATGPLLLVNGARVQAVEGPVGGAAIMQSWGDRAGAAHGQGGHGQASYGQRGYGQDGLSGGTEIVLAGTPLAAPAARRPESGTDTLTVSATNLQGRPDNGGLVTVHNEDDPRRLGPRGAESAVFQHGTATFSVPAGHYWATGAFAGDGGHSERLVVLPQFTVHGRTTVRLSERSASSKIGFTTPRPAVPRAVNFTLFRGAANGDLFIANWSRSGGISLWVSPTTSKPTVGTLESDTSAQLTSPSGGSGAPYAYNLAYPGLSGLIPVQHFVVSQASLATIVENYHQDVARTGSWCTIGGDVMPDGAFDFSCTYFLFRLPARQIQYLSTGPTTVWQMSYGESPAGTAGGQADVLRSFRPGQRVIQDWNAYPLHPQPDVQALRGRLGRRFPRVPAAFRAGNRLTLSPTPFSDNYRGHFGTGFIGGRGVKVTGSYTVYQNGTQIAHGNPLHQIPPVRLSARPSVIKFTLTASRQGPLFRFSPQTTTAWTWHSAPQPTATVPRSWSCGFTKTGFSQDCAVQPMMTLSYQVAGLALNGTTAAGPQTVNLTVGHLQLAKATAITGARAQVSVNDGHTFWAATVTPLGGGRFRVGFTAPARASVTLRVSATDAAGGSVTETILRGYGVGP